ncbi:MFS transporter [Paracoccus aminophilus]|uniref:MFS transporter n=1 Tax=Paracoccus aminophilus JCM 7686 TaxID=1367847 RepID=S5Y7J0_PARAH|nr:MFS transporter [Paracoccus aminophilus]AGT07308.1 MFS transporter [Paracoccus aminophilus JCM 7686]
MTAETTEFRANPGPSRAEVAESGLLRRAAFASFIGTFVEWFDYAVYGFLAAVIAKVFFPATDARSALMATYAVFALSFIVRPIGGVIWGHFGDKFGRKATLSLSIFIMSGATFVIAFLPGYQSVGMLAPVLLLLTRMVQGFAASGEFAGAASFLAEYAPDNRRGFFTCLVPAGEATGLLAASLFVAVLYGVLTEEQLLSWGWRLPFLMALPLGFVGVYIRRRLEESPHFQSLEEERHVPVAPVKELLQNHLPQIFTAFGGTLVNAVGFYLILIYMPTWLSDELGVGKEAAFLSATVTLLAYLCAIFLMGRLSDRIGRKRILLLCSGLFMVATLPLFSVLSSVDYTGMASGGYLLILAVLSLFGILFAMNGGTLATFLCELFPTRVRFSGFALSYNSANALFGGTAPLAATWIGGFIGAAYAPAWLLTIAAAITFVSIMFSRAGAPGAKLED